MTKCRSDHYQHLERFRDGGSHFDFPDGDEDEEGGWFAKCAVM